jgi:hypothetical protein
MELCGEIGRWWGIFSVSTKDAEKIPCGFLVNLYWKLNEFPQEIA